MATTRPDDSRRERHPRTASASRWGAVAGVYHCRQCGQYVTRASTREWIRSYCDRTERDVHLIRVPTADQRAASRRLAALGGSYPTASAPPRRRVPPRTTVSRSRG
jgi:hypothetical protein